MKKKSYTHSPYTNCELQDSGNVEDAVMSEETEKADDSLNQSTESDPAPTASSAAAGPKKKAAKSKTWFPGVRDTRTNVSGRMGGPRARPNALFSPTHSSHSDTSAGETASEAVVKKEPRVADPLVFVGSEEVAATIPAPEDFQVYTISCSLQSRSMLF